MKPLDLKKTLTHRENVSSPVFFYFDLKTRRKNSRHTKETWLSPSNIKLQNTHYCSWTRVTSAERCGWSSRHCNSNRTTHTQSPDPTKPISYQRPTRRRLHEMLGVVHSRSYRTVECQEEKRCSLNRTSTDRTRADRRSWRFFTFMLHIKQFSCCLFGHKLENPTFLLLRERRSWLIGWKQEHQC